MCSYSDWACKCQAQQALVGCFNNCPSDQARAANESQVTVYCNAAKRTKEEEERTMSKNTRRTVAAPTHEDDVGPTVVPRPRESRKSGKGVGESAMDSVGLADSAATRGCSTLALAGCVAAWMVLAI
ncbi:hypothetical protein LPJ77_003435 [Coemansia sp. RSA 2523]|nr:hypothetical protein LPJ58_001941 [Coemansia sp. RSA 1591]KAJ1764386.1 hypothetical protein LPJ69_001876 [Coemansia sp. RSA 1752]KAJ1776077.1 hypothetical protein LPJ54_003307 [Coemansia sp. RSA 1824]KAJ1786535.1 hypothetical protein LPJ62_003755 [Coemansia sp. RSA 2167]KAJ1806743.1 hypothetical protein LPJ77_003435 [Coemansia sp. RSA 2523]KAJ2129573.1 hypothetical protein GGF48_002377 [Coemansia sp. RSA 921]KAJ2150034.1 hypothetical protein J3F82_004226 [Coemansia sp. RSA 637]KAJ2163920.